MFGMAVLLFVSASVFAENSVTLPDSHPAFPTETSSAFQQLIDDAETAVGLQVYVRHGDHVWVGNSGLSDVAEQIPMGGNLPVRSASVTKLFTYTLITSLASEGHFTLETPVENLLPEETAAGLPLSGVTVHHLLEHTSGLYNLSDDHSGLYADMWSLPRNSDARWTPMELLEYARSQPAESAPGEQFSYSNTNFILLGLIAEEVTGTPLHQLYRERFFEPFGMENSVVEGFDGSERIGASYDIAGPEGESLGRDVGLFHDGQPILREDGLREISADQPASFNAWAWASGAIATTAEDLGHFVDSGLYDSELRLMANQDAFLAGELHDGQYGWTGGSWGISAVVWTSPVYDVTVVVLGNASADVFDTSALIGPLVRTAVTQSGD